MARAKAASRKPRNAALTTSIMACIANGERILDDATQLEFQKPPCTKLALSMIAQEEFAKAFILLLVREDVVPWSPQLLRAMRDHACKQLVGVIIEYIEPEWETIDQLDRIIREDIELGDRLPPRVASAINILRYEKISRWESNDWFWVDEPEYERPILSIAEGKRDRIKQDALYVRLGRDGSVASMPTGVTQAGADQEYARVGQYGRLVSSIVRNGGHESTGYEKVRETLRVLFCEET